MTVADPIAHFLAAFSSPVLSFTGGSAGVFRNDKVNIGRCRACI